MGDREMTIPVAAADSDDVTNGKGNTETAESEKKKLNKEEAEFIEKVFFEEDEQVRLRDGRTYRIPPLALKDGRKLVKMLNAIDASVIVSNLIDDENGEDKFNELLDVLLMAFKPYYKEITADYLAEYIDLHAAKQIIDIMIGLNGLKKSL